MTNLDEDNMVFNRAREGGDDGPVGDILWDIDTAGVAPRTASSSMGDGDDDVPVGDILWDIDTAGRDNSADWDFSG